MESYNRDEVMFWSDTHFGHANIIKYCDRPYQFPQTNTMDADMLSAFREAEDSGYTVFHCGDFVFNSDYLRKQKWRPEFEHVLILGNHDKSGNVGGKLRGLYEEFFTTIIGDSSTWRTHSHQIEVAYTIVMLSHEAQQNLRGADINLFGHHHNNMTRATGEKSREYRESYWWMLERPERYCNVGVELTGYVPVSLEEAKLLPKPKLEE